MPDSLITPALTEVPAPPGSASAALGLTVPRCTRIADGSCPEISRRLYCVPGFEAIEEGLELLEDALHAWASRIHENAMKHPEKLRVRDIRHASVALHKLASIRKTLHLLQARQDRLLARGQDPSPSLPLEDSARLMEQATQVWLELRQLAENLTTLYPENSLKIVKLLTRPLQSSSFSSSSSSSNSAESPKSEIQVRRPSEPSRPSEKAQWAFETDINSSSSSFSSSSSTPELNSAIRIPQSAI